MRRREIGTANGIDYLMTWDFGWPKPCLATDMVLPPQLKGYSALRACKATVFGASSRGPNKVGNLAGQFLMYQTNVRIRIAKSHSMLGTWRCSASQ